MRNSSEQTKSDVGPQDQIGFRYENPVVLQKGGCEVMSKFPLAIEEIA